MKAIVPFLLLVLASPFAQADREIRCTPGTPDSDGVKITEATTTIHWIGNMMEGYFAGQLHLKGADFANGDETVSATATPHYSEFNIWGDGANGRYIISTFWGGADDDMNKPYVGTITINNGSGFKKSAQVICTRTK